MVFRADVALVRMDAQVVNQDNRTITGLRAEDFLLLDEGRPRQICNFASENMPVDVLPLLDVSAGMRPHIERIASAAHEALRVLGTKIAWPLWCSTVRRGYRFHSATATRM